MKKIICFLLMAVLSMGMLVACGDPKNQETVVELKVWGSQADQVVLGTLVDGFKKANPDKKYKISFGVVGEPDAKTTILEDPTKAADVFSFADDQLMELEKAGTLYEVSGAYKERAIAANSESSIDAATRNGKLYAFPATADNGYILYYDKRAFNDVSKVNKLDDVLAVCNAAGKKFFMDISNGFYIMSFFVGAGCDLSLDASDTQVCTFNNEQGVKAGNAIKALCENAAFKTGDDTYITSQFGQDKEVVAAVSGIWNKDAFTKRVGAENLGAIKLPTFTCGTEQKQMSSFVGYKLTGVSKLTKNPKDALMLAEYITNEASQFTKFQERGYGPTNKAAAAKDEVKSNQVISALSTQASHGIPQGKSVTGKFWTPSEAFGTALENKDMGGKTMQEMLDAMVADICSK